MRNYNWLAAGFAAVASMGLIEGAARADDQPFLTVYTTDIDTQYEKEVEQSFYWATQKPHQAFNGFLSRSEFEYGVTDDLQASLYLNYDWEKSVPHPNGPADIEHATSISGEAIYRVLNVYFDPIGLAFYFEPTYGDNTRELEGKILLQKNFINDRLRLAANINFEREWERGDGDWDKEDAIEFFAGASYNITPEFSVGVEFNNENDFEGEAGAHNHSNVYYFGPTIQYVGMPFTVTLGTEMQLPWAHASDDGTDAVRDGYFADAERTRVGLRFKMDL